MRGKKTRLKTKSTNLKKFCHSWLEQESCGMQPAGNLDPHSPLPAPRFRGDKFSRDKFSGDKFSEDDIYIRILLY